MQAHYSYETKTDAYQPVSMMTSQGWSYEFLGVGVGAGVGVSGPEFFKGGGGVRWLMVDTIWTSFPIRLNDASFLLEKDGE